MRRSPARHTRGRECHGALRWSRPPSRQIQHRHSAESQRSLATPSSIAAFFLRTPKRTVSGYKRLCPGHKAQVTVPFTSKLGFSVVAPISVASPSRAVAHRVPSMHPLLSRRARQGARSIKEERSHASQAHGHPGPIPRIGRHRGRTRIRVMEHPGERVGGHLPRHRCQQDDHRHRGPLGAEPRLHMFPDGHDGLVCHAHRIGSHVGDEASGQARNLDAALV